MKIGFDEALGIHPQALQLRAQRTEVLANNIANADTPGFKARDVDFQAVLAAQTGADRGAKVAAMNVTHSGHLRARNADTIAAQLKYRTPILPSLDGNTVDGHVEQAEFANNTLRFMASLRFVDSKFKGLLTAIKGE